MSIKHDLNTAKRGIRTYIGLMSSIILAIILGSSCNSVVEPQLETGPYLLEHPRNFGGRYTIPEDNAMTKEGVALGRLLFYEPKMSANNTISCASCHIQELAFTDGRARSIGIDGMATQRNAMSLSNLLWVRNLFWDGRAPRLEAQAIFPLTDPHEMGQSLEETSLKLQRTDLYPPLFKLVFGTDTINGMRITKALAQFERTLISDKSPYDLYLKGEYQPTVQEQSGMDLFMNPPNPVEGTRGANCVQCHGGAKTYQELFVNNGLDSVPKDLGREQITGSTSDRGRFRVPTLRNIAVTAPYMHDGRFINLEQVLDQYNEHIQESESLSPVLRNTTNNDSNEVGLGLTKKEKEDIIAFLHMLTDHTFLNDPKFSNPHKTF